MAEGSYRFPLPERSRIWSLNLNYEPEVVVEDITELTEKEWRRYRTFGIGGSDAAAVCGISPGRQPRICMRKKLNHLSPPEDGWVAKEIGKRLEELVVQIFMKRTGLEAVCGAQNVSPPIISVYDGKCRFFVEIEGGIYIIECKTSFSYHMDQWEDGKIPPPLRTSGASLYGRDQCAGSDFSMSAWEQ